MNAIDITPVLQTLVGLIAAILTVVAVPWLRVKLNAEEMAEFLRWVEIGVAAAEQLFGATDGTKKKIYVINYLKEKGYTANFDDIDNAIEAAVLKLHKELYGGAVNDKQS